MGHLPVLEGRVSLRDPAVPDRHWVLGVVVLLPLDLVHRDGNDISHAVSRVDVIKKYKIAVLTKVSHPRSQVEVDVECVEEQLVEETLDVLVL